QALPSGVARNFLAWILRLLRLVAADFFMTVPPVGYKDRLQKSTVIDPDAKIPYQMVPMAIGDHYVPCWAHKKRRSAATSAVSKIPSQR
ncbi:TPA: hypothetical protein ACXF7R_004987, partial [Klebsiella pneumoniae]